MNTMCNRIRLLGLISIKYSMHNSFNTFGETIVSKETQLRENGDGAEVDRQKDVVIW